MRPTKTIKIEMGGPPSATDSDPTDIKHQSLVKSLWVIVVCSQDRTPLLSSRTANRETYKFLYCNTLSKIISPCKVILRGTDLPVNMLFISLPHSVQDDL